MLFEYAVMDSSNKMFLETVGFRCNSYVLLDSRLIVPEKLLIKLTETMKNKELSNFLIVGNDKIYR